MQIVDELWSDLLCRDEAQDKVVRGNYTASQSSRRERDEDLIRGWNHRRKRVPQRDEKLARGCLFSPRGEE